MMIRSTVFLLLCLAASAQCAKIVGVFPFPSKSHWLLGSTLLKELASRGHEVVMISPFPLTSAPPNYSDVDLSFLNDGLEQARSSFMQDDLEKMSVVTKLSIMFSSITELAEKMVSSKNLHDFLDTAGKVDLVIHMPLMNDALLAIGFKLKAPTVVFNLVGSNFMIDYYSGNPEPYSYVPNIYSKYSDNMNFWQRLVNTLTTTSLTLVYHYVNIPYQNYLMQKYFPGTPHVLDLINQIDLYLVNSHFTTESPRPYLPNMIKIGGFQMYEQQSLPTNVEDFLNNSKNGVIYMSLGTNMRSTDLPESTLRTILKLKYDILWKYEADLPARPRNVFTSKWLPQLTVLGHPKVKAFITHAGMGSVAESTFHGVPMICSPFISDQEKNCADVVNNNFGIHVNLRTTSEEQLNKAIREVLENPKYAEAIKMKSELFQEHEMNPMDRAVYWVEHVVKHKGAKHMRSKAIELSWYQYFLLDVVVVIAAVLLLVLGTMYYGVKKICSWLFKKNGRQGKKKTE